MAKANWVKTDREAGSGNGVVNVTSSAKYTGRKARESVLTWKAANADDVPRSVIQAGMPEYVDIADAAASEAAGKVVTVSGVSNSAKLTFSLGKGELEVALPDTYIAHSLTIKNGAAITGDPGSQTEYNFSISVTVPANVGTEPKTRQIIVTDEAGHQDTCVLTLAAGEPYIIIAMEVIELDYLGTPVAVYVESNTDWTVE